MKWSFKKWILHCTLNLWRFTQINYFTDIIHDPCRCRWLFLHMDVHTRVQFYISRHYLLMGSHHSEQLSSFTNRKQRCTNLSSLKALSDWNQSDSIENARTHSNKNLNRQLNNQSSTHRGPLCTQTPQKNRSCFCDPHSTLHWSQSKTIVIQSLHI